MDEPHGEASVSSGTFATQNRRWFCITTLSVGAYVLWQSTAGRHASPLTDDVTSGMWPLAAGIATWIGSRRPGIASEAAFTVRCVALALMLSATSYALDISFEIAGRTVGFPSYSDLLSLMFYPVVLLGVLRFPIRPHSASERWRFALDGATVTLCAAGVFWRVIVAPTLTASGRTPLVALVADAYPTGDLLLIFALARILIRGTTPRTRRPIQLLAAGMCVMIVGDLAYVCASLGGNGPAFRPSNTLSSVASAVFFFAAVLRQRLTGTPEDLAVPPPSSERQRATLLLPYLAPVLLMALQCEAQFGASQLTRFMLTGLSSTVLLMVVARQVSAQRDLARTVRVVSETTDQLHHQAMHDALTGLPNRALILDRVEHALSRARRNGETIAVMFLDLDGFKAVNDTYGHAVGDLLLQGVSQRLAGTLRASDTIGRLGGDEFVVLAEHFDARGGSELIADRLRTVLSEPFELASAGNPVIRTGASIGIAEGLRPSADELLRDADVALYEAKEAGKDRFVVFAHAMQTAVQERLLLETDLREAVVAEQFFLLYQPTVDLESGKIIGAEALLRWAHPRRGLVSPDDFVPLAEETALIVSIGRWVLREACRQAAEWERRGLALPVAVNVSGRQLHTDLDFIADVRQILSDTGLDPRLLTLEITETMVMRDTDVTASRLNVLKALGVRVAIDDFGTGFSSMAYLQKLPIDVIKIDRSFISGSSSTPDSRALVHTLIQLGQALGLQTHAEGIEDADQLELLRAEGCDTGQGYLFGRPMTAAAVEALTTLQLDGVALPPGR